MNTNEYNSIVRQWAPHLLRFANKNLRNLDEAKDVVQDAFEVLWKNKDIISTDKAKQYLFTVVFRKGIDVFRKIKPEEAIGESHFELKDKDQFDKQYSDKELVDKAISTLPDLQRQLVLLRDLEGYDYKEIGEIVGLSLSQVKVYLFRARKTLKETITTLEAI